MIRRAIGTTLVGLCALTGPMAFSAVAVDATAPALTLSANSVRRGIPFILGSETGCPSDSGVQSVELTFTDSAGLVFPLDPIETQDDGTWSGASVQLPVAGVDSSGAWQENGAAIGAGTLAAQCVAADVTADDPTDDPADDSGDTSADDPGDDATDDSGDPADDSTNPGDSSTDPEDPSDGDTTDPSDDSGDGVVTLTYASASLSVVGTAAQLTVTKLAGSNAVTVTPSEACAGTGVSDVDLAIVPIGNSTGDPVATASATSAANGSWLPVTLTLPTGTTGDFAVSATCSQDDAVISSYDAQPLALGSVLLGKPVCTAASALVRVTGSYSGEITNSEKPVRQDLLKLSGDGPWKVRLKSAATGKLLLSQTVACALPPYDLTVTKPGLADNGQLRARVCNTGRGTAVALLQVVAGKHAETVDQETVKPGDCTWLQGGRKVRRGDDVKAQILIDPPGKGGTNSEISQKFTAHRGKH